VTAEDRGRLDPLELPARWEETQRRMDGKPLVPREVVARGAECVADRQDAARRPPQRDLVPKAPAPDRDDLEGPKPGTRHDVMRNAEPGSQRGGVAVVPIEQLDHAGRFSGGADLLVEALAVERIDQPDAAVGDERVRATFHELVCDPAEAGIELVTGADAHAGQSTGTP
jgi:hypothetical protein